MRWAGALLLLGIAQTLTWFGECSPSWVALLSESDKTTDLVKEHKGVVLKDCDCAGCDGAYKIEKIAAGTCYDRCDMEPQCGMALMISTPTGAFQNCYRFVKGKQRVQYTSGHGQFQCYISETGCKNSPDEPTGLDCDSIQGITFNKGFTGTPTTAPPTLAGQIITPTGSYNEADAIFAGEMPGVKCYLGDVPVNKKPQVGNMNDLVIMSVTIGTPKDMFDSNPILRNNRINYAKQYGYNYCEMQDETIALHARAAQWDKIPLLARMVGHYNYLVLMDGDMLLGNTCVSFRHLIGSMGNADILLSEDLDFAPTPINTGVAIFKSGAFTKTLFSEEIHDKNLVNGLRHMWPFEQGAFVRFSQRYPNQFCRPDPGRFEEANVETNHFHWAEPGPQCKVVVHALGPHFQQFFSQWQKGAMFVHFTGPNIDQGNKYGQQADALRHDSRMCRQGDADCHCDAQYR